MKLSDHQQTFTANIAKLINHALVLGIDLTFGEAFRTREQQEIYFKNGKSKTMNSNHLRRLAVDFNFFIEGKLTYKHPRITELGKYWESLHPMNRWGGNFKNFYDAPHFEMNV